MFNNNYGNPYYQQQRFQPNMQTQYVPNIDTQNTLQAQYMQPTFTKQNVLMGKQVDSIEVVKATDIPFEGISYFPLTDGSAIVTKQIQLDGTSKIVVFKPVDEQKAEIRYITHDDLKNALDSLNFDEIDDIKEELKEIKKQLKKKGE